MLCKAACPATCIQLVVLLSAWYGVACLKQQPRVAIIGAGIGGTAAAYFLREELGPEVHLDIFEQGEVGGRTQIWQNGSEVYEMGASIIHEENKYFRELTDKMGLERVQLGDDSNEVSIWDGQAFVFNESAWSLVTLYRMIRRYGLSYFYMRGAPAETLQRYKRLYDIQAEGQAFDTPEELLKAVDLYNLTQRTFRDELLGRIGWGTAAQKFAGEFVAGINRIQYNQGNGINAMAGMVSMLGAIDGRLFNIKGGNRQLAERLIKASDASLHLGTRVTGIYRREHGTYELHTKCTSASLEESHSSKYDAVLVAVPLELTNITISGADHTGLPRRVYQRTVATLVRGRLRPSYFGVQQVPKGEYVMVTENSTAPFSVVSRQREVPEGRKVFKLFSRQPLSNETLQSIFQDLTVLAVRDWEAYPHFSPPERFQPFKLAPGLYLNNAWENAASAMEMSAVAAKNCALLIARHLRESSACQVPDALIHSAKGSDVATILDS